MSDADNARTAPDATTNASTGNRRPILLAVSLLVLAVGAAAAVTGTLAAASADDARDAAKRDLQVARDEVARAETALSNSQDEVESHEGSARATLQIALESASSLDRLLAINERQVQIARDQRDATLSPGREISRYNALVDEGNALGAEYDRVIDEVHRIERETTPDSLED